MKLVITIESEKLVDSNRLADTQGAIEAESLLHEVGDLLVRGQFQGEIVGEGSATVRWEPADG